MSQRNDIQAIPSCVVGEALLDLLENAYFADRCALLEGHTGVGKSQIFAQLADRLGIGFLTIDLTLVERTDLIGIPRIVGDRVEFVPPKIWPTEGSGILVFEELNRAPRYVRSAALEILTRHSVGDLPLPPGWRFGACVNPAGGDYQVDVLCSALRSRFFELAVQADVVEWARWARREGIHPKIVEFVEASPDVFDGGRSNPRAWVHASAQLEMAEKRGASAERIEQVVGGEVGTIWALAFVEHYLGKAKPLKVSAIVADYSINRTKLQRWVRTRRLDLVDATLRGVQRHLRSDRNYRIVLRNPKKLANVRNLVADLPADLRRDFTKWLVENGRGDIVIPDLEEAA